MALLTSHPQLEAIKAKLIEEAFFVHHSMEYVICTLDGMPFGPQDENEAQLHANELPLKAGLEAVLLKIEAPSKYKPISNKAAE